MAHVADVERSIGFYELLGFKVGNRMQEGGRTNWASVGSGAASLMLAVASDPVKPEQQAILFLYCRDVPAMREHLLASGVADGGKSCGGPGPNRGRCVVFEATYPDYMPKGELRVADPDGYCLLIGQDD